MKYELIIYPVIDELERRHRRKQRGIRSGELVIMQSHDGWNMSLSDFRENRRGKMMINIMYVNDVRTNIIQHASE